VSIVYLPGPTSKRHPGAMDADAKLAIPATPWISAGETYPRLPAIIDTDQFVLGFWRLGRALKYFY
jgi:hypothetical protein